MGWRWQGSQKNHSCFWTGVLEKTPESPLDCKEIKPVHPKGKHSWIIIGRTDAEAEAPILWLPDVKILLIGKDPDAGKIEGRKRKGWQRMRWLHGIISSLDLSLSKPWEMVMDREAWYATVYGIAKVQTWLSNWTTMCPLMEQTVPYLYHASPLFFNSHHKFERSGS